MTAWYTKFPERFIFEYKSIEQLVEDDKETFLHGRWKIIDDSLIYSCDVNLETGVFPIEMRYPFFFPLSPVFVTQNNPDGKVMNWSPHQYNGGTLCLEYGPDNWNFSITGAMILQSTAKLLMTEEKGGVVESRDEFTIGQNLRFTKHRLVLSNEFIKYLNDPCEFLVAKFTMDNVSVYRPLCMATPDNATVLYIDKRMIHQTSKTIIGLYLGSDLNDALSLKLRKQHENASELLLLLKKENEGLFAFLQREIVKEGEEEVISVKILKNEDNRNRNPYTGKELGKKKIAIIGLGSLGSKIADSLARIGVEEFCLIDGDVFKDSNVQRHILVYDSVGFMKVEALKNHLLRINPDIKITSRSVALGAMESSSYYDLLLQEIGACDLVIDSTANAQCFEILGNITLARQVPLVWGQVYAGGLGGFVAHSDNQDDGGAFHIHQSYEDFTSENPYNRGTKVSDYSEIIGDTVLIASDADVSIIASWMVQVSLSILLNLDNFPKPIYLYGFRREWVFRCAGQMIELDTREKPQKLQPIVDASTKMEANRIIGEIINSDESNSSR